MISRRLLLLTAVAVLGLGATASYAEQPQPDSTAPTPSFTGYVRNDQDSMPIVSASVRVDGTHIIGDITDSTGRFDMYYNMPTDLYTVKISHMLYNSVIDSIRIVKDSTIRRVFYMHLKETELCVSKSVVWRKPGETTEAAASANLGSDSLRQTTATEDRQYILTGCVRSERDSLPIRGASVHFMETKFGAATDSIGCFKVKPVLQTGWYKLRVTAVGYEPFEIDSLRIEADSTVNRDFYLKVHHTDLHHPVTVKGDYNKDTADKK